ncbi:MAG: hypothetical protein FLDDKLPJ_03629 [Phycisphaerae bacterium]|nr:hypothetical protein [Phycisphaerae bacterium]
MGHQGLIFDRYCGNSIEDPCITTTQKGLYHNRNRYYHARLGRFTTPDPNESALPTLPLTHSGSEWSIHIGSYAPGGQHQDGNNLYGYVSSNPIIRRDPAGTFSLLDTLETASINAYVRGSQFAAAHPVATRVMGGLLAAFDLYAFIQYEEVQAVVMSQPNPGGIVAGQLAAMRSALGEVLATGGSFRALANLSDDALGWVRRSRAFALSQTPGAAVAGELRVIRISRSRWPEAAAHIAEAQASGHPSILTIDRAGANTRRQAALAAHPIQKGMDRDEYPPAVFLEGGSGASVRVIKVGDNRGAGAAMRSQISGLQDGTQVKVEVVP